MGDILKKLLTDEIDDKKLIKWLLNSDYQADFGASRTDFITFFLNFLHEDVLGKENVPEENKNSPRTPEQNSPNMQTSTPKLSREDNYTSPVSPLYKNRSFSTPTTPKPSPLCFGDFITNKSGTKKKSRRIKPTNLLEKSSFHKSENSFNFSEEANELPRERNLLVEEKMKVTIKSDNNASRKLLFKTEVLPDRTSVTHKRQIDKLVMIYSTLLDSNCVVNLVSEFHFLITLLLKKQFEDLVDGSSEARKLFQSIHNVVYFASKSLENSVKILQVFDKAIIKLLVENERLRSFAPGLVEKLERIPKTDGVTLGALIQDNVCFNQDTDNRQNFPNDPSFHAFRKQRDLFYEILRIWEQQHSTPGFSFVAVVGKIRSLLTLHDEPTNLVHFARLFRGQLLSTCGGNEEGCENIISSLGVDAEKLNRLRSRCTRRESSHGLNSLPKFSESEEFYKEFIMVASSSSFNRHLSDAIIEEIVELNGTDFGSIEVENKENDVDSATKKSYFLCIRSLRLLAKFQGLLDSLPYKTDCKYSDYISTTHVKIRKLVHPNFDVKRILDDSFHKQTTVLCVPWLTTYLAMLDRVTLTLPYYTSILKMLFKIYRNFDFGPPCNVFLVKFCLGWFFDLPHVPENYYNLGSREEMTADKMALDNMEIVDQNILCFCCPHLDEIKKLLTADVINSSLSFKHITPVTAVQSPDEVARKKIEQQLVEAFFNGQPVSLRKTVDFVSERVASTCVKFICGNLVPRHRKMAVEKLKVSDLPLAHQLSLACLCELRSACDREVSEICARKIPTAVDSLLSLDVLPQTRDVCRGLTTKSCLERVRQWTDAHVTSVIFSKDFDEEIHRAGVGRRGRPTFALPPGGSRSTDESSTSGAHLIELIRAMILDVAEKKKISQTLLLKLLDDVRGSIKSRGDINDCVGATISTMLLDLALIIIANDGSLICDVVLSKFLTVWDGDLFKSLLCPRNIRIFNQSDDTTKAWNSMAAFCCFLLREKVLSCEDFESQCMGMFRIEWDQKTLRCLSDFLRKVLELCGRGDNFTAFLDFLSDFCEDL